MTDKKGDWLGISGFTLAIVGFYNFFWISVLSSPIFITGFVFSLIQMKKHKTKLSLWGLILNVVGIVLNIVLLIIILKNPSLYTAS